MGGCWWRETEQRQIRMSRLRKMARWRREMGKEIEEIAAKGRKTRRSFFRGVASGNPGDYAIVFAGSKVMARHKEWDECDGEEMSNPIKPNQTGSNLPEPQMPSARRRWRRARRSRSLAKRARIGLRAIQAYPTKSDPIKRPVAGREDGATAADNRRKRRSCYG
jgi:hypothetical protein